MIDLKVLDDCFNENPNQLNLMVSVLIAGLSKHSLDFYFKNPEEFISDANIAIALAIRIEEARKEMWDYIVKDPDGLIDDSIKEHLNRFFKERPDLAERIQKSMEKVREKHQQQKNNEK